MEIFKLLTKLKVFCIYQPTQRGQSKTLPTTTESVVTNTATSSSKSMNIHCPSSLMISAIQSISSLLAARTEITCASTTTVILITTTTVTTLITATTATTPITATVTASATPISCPTVPQKLPARLHCRNPLLLNH